MKKYTLYLLLYNFLYHFGSGTFFQIQKIIDTFKLNKCSCRIIDDDGVLVTDIFAFYSDPLKESDIKFPIRLCPVTRIHDVVINDVRYKELYEESYSGALTGNRWLRTLTEYREFIKHNPKATWVDIKNFIKGGIAQ